MLRDLLDLVTDESGAERHIYRAPELMRHSHDVLISTPEPSIVELQTVIVRKVADYEAAVVVPLHYSKELLKEVAESIHALDVPRVKKL